MDLIIVESPTKAKTLGKYLGSDYKIEASFGHVRDLPERKLGIDVEKGFEPTYVQTDKQKKRTNEIKVLAREAKTVYLATDPDREGEAISWHVEQVLKLKKAKRIAFHEITKTAIEAAIAHPREIDQLLVDAQQARRILDRLVGYKLSPVLWKKIRRGLSAGRVQSVALRLVVEREREIEAFKPVEYWDLQVTLEKMSQKGKKLTVKLVDEVKNGEDASRIEKDLRGGKYVVESVEKKDFKRTPPAPYTTSTLQQAAANRLGWTAKKTMQVAQSLYEEGLITYHRTDSTNVAQEASEAVAKLILDKYGREYALEKPRVYATKSKVAQEAHEAIRPTNMELNVLPVEQYNRDQGKLYETIWKRFVACQMNEVTGESLKVVVNGAEKYKLEAKGEVIKFDGWYRVLEKDSEEKLLPEVETGEALKFVDMTTEQKFTAPPARYNDAGLIKALEEMGIGRPSTYAPTISTIQDRQYVERIEKRFKPTDLGITVSDFLVSNFGKIVDYDFTAKMEDDLDEIANGKHTWKKVLTDFYTPFEKHLEVVTKTAERVAVPVEKTGETCPECGQGEVVIRTGRFGKFLSCERFPDCKYKANYQNKIGMKCPKCSVGEVIMRKSRTGRSFFGCSTYPTCDFASWNKPVVPGTTENPVVAVANDTAVV